MGCESHGNHEWVEVSQATDSNPATHAPQECPGCQHTPCDSTESFGHGCVLTMQL